MFLLIIFYSIGLIKYAKFEMKQRMVLESGTNDLSRRNLRKAFLEKVEKKNLVSIVPL